MKIIEFKKDDEGVKEWEYCRRGKITGTKLKDIIPKTRGEGKRAGYYQLIAERIAVPHNGENVMDRGKRIEEEAIEAFEKKTGKKVDKRLLIICRDDNEDIAYSPDGIIGKTEDVEVKSLNSGSHIEAFLTKQIPKEYEYQILQAFVVNDKLKKRYMVFYDPRMPVDMFYIEVKRSDVKDKLDELFVLEKQVLEEIDRLEVELTF